MKLATILVIAAAAGLLWPIGQAIPLVLVVPLLGVLVLAVDWAIGGDE